MSAACIAIDARFVNDRYHGIGRHAFNIIEAVTRLDQGHRYILFHNPAYPNSRFNLHALQERANVRLVPTGLPLFWPHEQFVWPLLLARAGAGLFHSPYISLPLLAPIPLVLTVHDLILERFPEYMPRRWLRGAYATVVQWGLRRASVVFTVSQSSRTDIDHYYHVNPAKVHVIGNAVDTSFRRIVDPMRVRAVRGRYRLPDRFMLTVGVGRPHKNVELLVDAFGRLRPDLAPDLVIVGGSDTRFPDGVAACVRALGLERRVHRLGNVREEDLPVVYSLATLFVLPSLVEGFGFPVLEAMACGAPVLASSTPSIDEVARGAALSFDPRDPAALAVHMTAVLSDAVLRADLARRSLERAKQFSWESVGRATLAGYAAALGTGSRA